MFGCVLETVSGFIGELAEVHFVGVARACQHADVRAGAEDARLGRAQNDGLDARMLEAKTRDRVGEFDVDAEIVGIEFELIAFEEAAVLVHIERESRDVGVDRQLPMPIARGIGLEVYAFGAIGERSRCLGHVGFLSGGSVLLEL